MRIAIDARKWRDFGIGRYIRGLVTALAARVEDELVAIAPADVAAELPANVRLAQNASPHYSLREIFAVGRAASTIGADVFHAPHYVLPSVDAPKVVTIHDLIHLELFGSTTQLHRRMYAELMLRRAAREAAVVLTVSESVAGAIRRRLPAAREKVRVTPNGVDAVFFAEVERWRVEAELQALGLEPQRYFLFVGNDKPHKNLELLVAAFRELHARRPTARLVVVGSSGESDAVVRRPGFVSDQMLRTLYAGAVALVLPSSYEGFGLPVAEAMAGGCAVIASDIDALRETGGSAALFVQPRDGDALANAMLRLYDNAPLREELRGRGRDQAARFTWSRCAELTREAYEEAIGRR